MGWTSPGCKWNDEGELGTRGGGGPAPRDVTVKGVGADVEIGDLDVADGVPPDPPGGSGPPDPPVAAAMVRFRFQQSGWSFFCSSAKSLALSE